VLGPTFPTIASLTPSHTCSRGNLIAIRFVVAHCISSQDSVLRGTPSSSTVSAHESDLRSGACIARRIVVGREMVAFVNGCKLGPISGSRKLDNRNSTDPSHFITEATNALNRARNSIEGGSSLETCCLSCQILPSMLTDRGLWVRLPGCFSAGALSHYKLTFIDQRTME
jgi:hypothetical protein